MTRRSLTLIVVAAAALAVVSLVAQEPEKTRGDPADAKARFEQTFASMSAAIDHHAMAVETGRLCLERAIHEELRTLCGQKQEHRAMQDFAALYGAEFEIAFMEMMIEHHQGAIREGAECIEEAHHRQLVRLCERIIATQSAEIEQMRTWLCEWYGRCK